MSKTIYILEEDSGIQDVMQYILEYAGYEVVVTDEKELALDIALLRPDLVILDLWLAEKEHFQIFKKLRSERRTKQVPILGTTTEQKVEPMIEELIDDVIHKPFDIKELRDKVSMLLEEMRK